MPNSITVRGFILTYGDKLRWRWHGGRIIYSIFLKLSVYFFYNLMAHFLTAGYRSKLVSDKNSIRICSNIIGQSGRQIIPYYMDFNVIQKNDALDIEKCGIFFLLFFFPIVFPCGHLICGFCYVRQFKLHHYERFGTYFTKCPDCSEFV